MVDAHALEVPMALSGEARLLVAGRVGKARLIDNVGTEVPRPENRPLGGLAQHGEALEGTGSPSAVPPGD